MRNLAWFFGGIGLVVLLAWAMEASAQSTDSCSQNPTTLLWYKWSAASSAGVYGFHATAAQACQAYDDATTAYDAGYSKPFYVFGEWGSDPRCRTTKISTGTVYNVVTLSRILQSDPATQCPADVVECNASYVGGKFATIVSLGTELPAETCDAASNCKGVIDWGSKTCIDNCGALYDVVDSPCSVGTGPGELPAPPGTVTDPAPAETCVGPVAAEYCYSQEGSQCGYLNDQYLCLTNTRKDGCQSLPDGSKVCGPDAVPPAAPDNGVSPTVPATPDEQITRATDSGDTITYNYYTSGTVGASTHVPTDTPSQNQDSSGDGYTSPEEAEGGIECPGGNCFPDGIGNEAIDLDSVTSQYWSRIQGAPLVTAISGLSASVPSGTCPEFSFTIYGTPMAISAGCEFMPDIAPILELAFLAGWCLLGVRIVISA